MCKLTITSTQKKIEGYKIVAKKPRGKRYFSIAMGFKYPSDGHVPVARKQHRICSNFLSDILSKNSAGYQELIVGRTTVYLDLADVLNEHHHLIQRQEKDNIWGHDIREGYELVVVRAEVTIDIMKGFYTACGRDCAVAAGRHIRFIKEIERA